MGVGKLVKSSAKIKGFHEKIKANILQTEIIQQKWPI